MRQPTASRAPVRIGKYKNVVSFLRLLDGCAKVVHFLSASLGPPRDNDVNAVFAGSRELIENLAGWVLATRQCEKNIVVGIVKRGEGREILLEPRLDALDRTNQRDARRVEPRMAPNPPLCHAQPAQPVPKVVHSLQDLFHDQEVEECKQHGWPPCFSVPGGAYQITLAARHGAARIRIGAYSIRTLARHREAHRFRVTPRNIRLATGWSALNAGINFHFEVEPMSPSSTCPLPSISADRTFPAESITSFKFDSDCANPSSYAVNGGGRCMRMGLGGVISSWGVTSLGVTPGVAATMVVASKIFA